MRTALRTFAEWEVTGSENIPPVGPVIVVANHQSNIDPPLIGASFNRRPFFLAKDGIFKGKLITWFLRNYGAFPIKRHGLDVEAFRWALEVLSQDKPLVIFPEGTRSPGKMKKALPGVALLAVKTQAPLLPVGITGSEGIGPLWRVACPTGHIKVNIGQLFSLPVIEGKLGRAQLDGITTQIMQRIAMLLPESYHGVYGSSQEEVPSSQDFAPDTIEVASSLKLIDD